MRYVAPRIFQVEGAVTNASHSSVLRSPATRKVLAAMCSKTRQTNWERRKFAPALLADFSNRIIKSS
jgi:hypothetical protein